MINLWWNNLGDLAANVISASSYSTGFPASNVANNQPGVKWLTGATLTTEWILFDLGSAMSITDFICAFHSFTGSDSSFTLQYGSSATTGSGGLATPAGTQSITFAAGAMQQSFSAQNYRYWCFVFTKGSSSEVASIGRIFLGTLTNINPPDLINGAQIIRNDLSVVNTAKSGQDYGLLKPSKRLFTLTWTNALDTDYRAMDNIYVTGGKVLKFFMQIDPANLTGDTDLSSIVYVRINADPQNLETDALDSAQCWDMEYDLLEQI